MKNKVKNLSGQRYGMVVVTDEYFIKNGRTYWICRCDCGNTFVRRSDIIKRSDVKSCGCYQKKRNKTSSLKHGDGPRSSEYHKLYNVWQSMKNRCFNDKYFQFKDWGGRGITVCDDWIGENGYINFKEWALSHGYNEKLTIDRIEVNGNYEPSNCRWITRAEQNKNTRKCKHIEYNGKYYTPPELGRLFGISATVVRYWLFDKNKTVEWLCANKANKGGDVE